MVSKRSKHFMAWSFAFVDISAALLQAIKPCPISVLERETSDFNADVIFLPRLKEVKNYQSDGDGRIVKFMESPHLELKERSSLFFDEGKNLLTIP